jgi:hypothetical protein
MVEPFKGWVRIGAAGCELDGIGNSKMAAIQIPGMDFIKGSMNAYSHD